MSVYYVRHDGNDSINYNFAYKWFCVLPILLHCHKRITADGLKRRNLCVILENGCWRRQIILWRFA